ncbi:MAG: hypothetical protein RL169_1104 [Armatimonadota bacterium]
MSRRTLPLLLTAILMLTGFLLPALRVTACLTANTGMPAGCPMKAATSAKPIEAAKPADKHGCCIEKAPKPETKVITGSCCCTIKAAAKPIVRDYRAGFNVGEIAIAFEHRRELLRPAVLTAPSAKCLLLDVQISRGPPRGSSPLRGPPSNS